MTETILYIEDNDQNYYLVQYILTAKGYQVIHAADGREGITLADTTRPDLILLDFQLPGMDGYETARRLRQIQAITVLPIVALTSYAMPGDREKALSAGCNGYIEKPINPATFISQIEAYLPTAKSREEQ
jgi:CheY-like chemotaxis protein